MYDTICGLTLVMIHTVIRLTVSINLEGAGLTEIPTTLSSDITFLALSDNLISSIPSNAFHSFTDLVDIELNKNLLTEFPNVVPVADTLTKLDISENSLTYVPQNIISELVNLRYLKIGKNSITLLPDLSMLDQLIDFNGYKNLYTTLDTNALADLADISEIHLNNNPPLTIGIDLVLSATLVTLKLGKNTLGPTGYICDLGPNECSLDVLYNHETNLDAVPQMFDFKDNLTQLYLSTNSLTDVGVAGETGLQIFTTLFILDCSHNLLTQIPNLSGSIETIREIHLVNNSITTVLPIHVMGMINLQTLDLSMNAITTLPYFPINSLTSLTQLNIDQQDINCNCEMAWMKSTNTIIPAAPCVTPVSMLNVVLDDIPEEDFICDWTILTGNISYCGIKLMMMMCNENNALLDVTLD